MVQASVTKMMSFDANQDGKLSKSEVADPRLQPLFTRADTDNDDIVTKEELTALFTREADSVPAGPEGNFPPGVLPGNADGRNPFGGPPGGRGGRPRPGEVLPGFLQDELQLTPRQKAQLEKLQQDVDSRLAKILTDKQRQRLDELAQRGPGGPPPGGPDGFAPPPGERRAGRRPPR